MSGRRRALSDAVAMALTRREFLAAAAAAGVAASVTLPAPLAAGAYAPAGARLDDWTIDDMWGVYPRYADPIGYGRLPAPPLVATNTVDAAFAPI